jgi:hypothetical protein
MNILFSRRAGAETIVYGRGSVAARRFARRLQ